MKDALHTETHAQVGKMMKTYDECISYLKNTRSREAFYKVLYMWLKQDLISQKVFISVINYCTIHSPIEM